MFTSLPVQAGGTLSRVPASDLEEAVGVHLDTVLVPGYVRPRLPRRRAHEDDLATQDVLRLEMGPLADLSTLSTTGKLRR